MLFSKVFLALSATASALAVDPQIVSLPVRLSAGSIMQTYPGDTRPLYDYIDDTVGAPLRVLDGRVIKPSNGILGTQFNFVPVKSSFMGYPQSLATAYGHVVLSSDTSLALTVSLAKGDMVPRLAPVAKADSALQMDQFWSYQPSTGILIFLGSIYHEETFAPVGYGPVVPETVPDTVTVTNIFMTQGRFVFTGGKVTNPCPPLPSASLSVRSHEARAAIGPGGIICPL